MWERYGAHNNKASKHSRTLSLPHCIGVFWLCTGNDRLDVLLVGDINASICRIFRCWPWLNTMDDNRRTILAGSTAKCNGHRRIGELDGKFCRWHRFPHFTSKNNYLLIFLYTFSLNRGFLSFFRLTGSIGKLHILAI